MSAFSDPVLFFVNLAVNLLVFGCFIAVGVAFSFRLIKNANPRLRYIVAVTAFLFAACAPLAATFTGSFGSDDFFASKNVNIENSFDAVLPAQTSVIAAPEIAAPPTKPEPEKTTNDFLNNFTAAAADSLLGKSLFSLWILVAPVFVLRDILSLRRLTKARKLWREATASERKELDFPDETRLCFSEVSPATVGFFRPSVVLPENFPDDLSLSQRCCIARHELSHARWRDPLIGFALRLIRALFWFSPALWMLERIAVGERESAADRAAVGNCLGNELQGNVTALDYATTLVSVAKHFNFQARREFLGANTAGFSNSNILENRVRRLLAQSAKTTTFHLTCAAAVFAGSLAGLFFMPIAFQSEVASFEALEAVGDYQEAENLIRVENFNDSQILNRQNEPPRIIAISENKKVKESALSQNENQSESYLAANKKTFQIPRVVIINGKSVKSSDGKAADDSEDSIRKLGEEDARAAGFNQKLDELSNKAQGLDALKKNLESEIPQVRQKAAAQTDALMRRMQTENDSGRKPN